MLIKPTHSQSVDARIMDVVLKGRGGKSICLVDKKGNVLSTTRLRVSGPEAIQARTKLVLNPTVNGKETSCVPVLVYESNPQQTATFMGRDHLEVTAELGKSVGLKMASIRKIKAERETIEAARWRKPSLAP